MITRQANGAHLGYDSFSARESIAARFYDRTFSVSTDAHAVIRNRQLVAAALGYALPENPDYGVSGAGNDAMSGVDWLPTTPCHLLTATSRDDKLWLEASWVDLGNALRALGYTTVLPGGSPIERERRRVWPARSQMPLLHPRSALINLRRCLLRVVLQWC